MEEVATAVVVAVVEAREGTRGGPRVVPVEADRHEDDMGGQVIGGQTVAQSVTTTVVPRATLDGVTAVIPAVTVGEDAVEEE